MACPMGTGCHQQVFSKKRRCRGDSGVPGRSCKVLLDRSQQPCPEEEAEAGGKEGPGRCLLRAERIDNWTSL